MSRERVVVVMTRIQLSKTHDDRKYFKLMGSLQINFCYKSHVYVVIRPRFNGTPKDGTLPAWLLPLDLGVLFHAFAPAVLWARSFYLQQGVLRMMALLDLALRCYMNSAGNQYTYPAAHLL